MKVSIAKAYLAKSLKTTFVKAKQAQCEPKIVSVETKQAQCKPKSTSGEAKQAQCQSKQAQCETKQAQCEPTVAFGKAKLPVAASGEASKTVQQSTSASGD